MVLEFFRRGSESQLEQIESKIGQMLGDARHSFDLAASALLAGADPAVVGHDVHATDKRINATEREVRRDLVVHVSVHVRELRPADDPCLHGRGQGRRAHRRLCQEHLRPRQSGHRPLGGRRSRTAHLVPPAGIAVDLTDRPDVPGSGHRRCPTLPGRGRCPPQGVRRPDQRVASHPSEPSSYGVPRALCTSVISSGSRLIS